MNREQALAIVRDLFLKALPRLQVGPRMKRMVRLLEGVLEIAGDRIPLHERRPVRVVAIGKAANEMTATLAQILDGVRLRGVVAAPAIPKVQAPGFEYFAGGHPYPNEQSWLAAEAAIALLDQRNVTSDDLVIFLVSGGGSSLMELPLYPRMMSLQDVRLLYDLLVTCGASIEEINTVRKHLSAVKGGRLAENAWPARQITLYVSDVPEYSPSMVASGPSMPDETMVFDANSVLQKYGPLSMLLPAYKVLWTETPKPGDHCFEQSQYYCLLSNGDAIDAVLESAEGQGIVAEANTRCDDWAYTEAAEYLLSNLTQLQQENSGTPVAVVSGGELTCPVTGEGIGGRNQAFVLDCVCRIANQRVIVLSGGTDGIDGNSPACGAIADGESMAKARSMGLDVENFRRRSDSFHFFERLGDALITGPTGTNVRDIRILLAYPE